MNSSSPDAHLIACSPELYNALKIMVDHEVSYMIKNNLGNPHEQDRIINAIKVLKKARGGE